MAIKSGRAGRVRWNPIGASSPDDLTEIISLNSWKLSLKTDFEDVSCFGDENRVYVPGMRDLSGSLGGFFNIAELAVITATAATTPGMLDLCHNVDDGAGSPLDAPTFGGLAYLDADIDCSVKGAPKLTASFRAAGPWTLPT